jgi:hypothetical protein
MKRPTWLIVVLLFSPTLRAGEDVRVNQSAREHWAFHPVQRPTVPEVRNREWARGDIDRFIQARLESENLSPAPQADRHTLMRRLSFALTGLSPAPEDLASHLDDESDPTLGKYIDDLMGSEEFGVHWARHWLDHVRYRPFPGKLAINDPYRLWVMKAFNQDLPYNRFLKMQIAGDLLPGPDPEQKVHLDGMVAVRPFSLKNRPPEQIDLLGRTFMGLSLACAECHDHKLEPLSRDDYYALRGLFESSQVIKAPYLESKAQFAEYMTGLAHKQKNEQRMKNELKEFARVSQLMDLRERIANERKRIDDPKEERNREKLEKNLANMLKDEEKRVAEIEKRKIKLDAPEALEYINLNNENKEFTEKWKSVYQFDAFVDQSDPSKITDAAPPKEGVKVKPGEAPPRDSPVPRRFPVILAGESQKPLGERTKQSGRLELADWLGDPAHPITARLMVNRVWYYLMGEGIVPSLSNFGHSGQAPTHPLLLDHLAAEFVAENWSMKSLIRRIVLSATFQQTSKMELGADERDQRLGLYGLARSRRLEAESVWRTLHLLEYDPESKESRRDPNHEMVQEVSRLFDGAHSNLILPRRSASISSLQALFFLNSPHVRRSTTKLAVRLHRLPDDADRIQNSHLLLYGREATAEDLAAGQEFIAAWKPEAPREDDRLPKNGPPHEAVAKWRAYLQAMLATNEFLFVD